MNCYGRSYTENSLQNRVKPCQKNSLIEIITSIRKYQKGSSGFQAGNNCTAIAKYF